MHSGAISMHSGASLIHSGAFRCYIDAFRCISVHLICANFIQVISHFGLPILTNRLESKITPGQRSFPANQSCPFSHLLPPKVTCVTLHCTRTFHLFVPLYSIGTTATQPSSSASLSEKSFLQEVSPHFFHTLLEPILSGELSHVLASVISTGAPCLTCPASSIISLAGNI